MLSRIDLSRFLKAQEKIYENALDEIKNGFKSSHWIWFVFPQLKELGSSKRSKYFGIKDHYEAEEYLNHPILRKRLVEISTALLNLKSNDAKIILGKIDSIKLKSSITLFSDVKNTDPVFECILNKFFDGKKDTYTMLLLKKYSEFSK